MEIFKNKLANKSVLDIIHEEAQDEQFQFLGVKLTKTEAVCTKPTGSDLNTNFASHTHIN